MQRKQRNPADNLRDYHRLYPRVLQTGWYLRYVLSDNAKRTPRKSGTTVFATVAKNAMANLAKMGASWLIVLLLPPLLVRVLDKPTYATWVLILQIGAYVAVFDGGIQSAIGRFVARADGLQDDRYMGQTLSSAGLVMLLAGLATASLTALVSWQLDHLFHGIPSSIGPDARKALFVVGMSLALSLPFSTLAGVFLGLQMNQVNALAVSVGRIAGAAGAAWAAYHHQGLYAMALWIGLGNLLQALIYLLSWKRFNASGFFRRAHIARSAIREFVNFCYAMFATQLGGILITGLDMPVVAAFDFHAAAYYAVAATASTMLNAQGAIVTTLIPVASGMSAVETPHRLGQMVLKTTRYATAILCILTLPLLFGMYPFLRLWVGLDYASHALILAVILVVAQFIRMTLMPYAAVGFGTGQQQQMLISPLGEGIVNLICSVIGAHFFGAIGVAVGTLIGACVGVVLHFTVSMPRTDSMEFPRLRLALTGILKPIACCLPSAFLLLILTHPTQNIFRSLALIVAGEFFAILVLWRINFDTRERNEIAGLVLRFVHS
ncbi:MAG: lipopolysaccharide biosynthesis protein [Acidobacteriaceae bacterium]